jgi:hypothetical protein
MNLLGVETYITLLFPFDRELHPYVQGIESELPGLRFDIGGELSAFMELTESTVEARLVFVDGMKPESYAPLGLSGHDVESRLHARRAGAVLHLSASAEVDVPETRSFPVSDGTEWVMDRRQLEVFYRQEFVRAMNGIDAKLAVVLNLARPGVFDIGPSFSTDGEFVEASDVIVSSLSMAATAALRNGWPSFAPIAAQQAWDWVSAGDYIDCMGETRVGRAFNAYSRLFGSISRGAGSEDLFWALMGLEALFCDGTAGSMSQVVSRSQLLLGAHPPLKKAFTRAYGVRSAFIHGGLPFPGQFFQSHGLEAFEDFSHATGEALTTAEAILVGALRELITRGWHSIEFITELNGSASASASSNER